MHRKLSNGYATYALPEVYFQSQQAGNLDCTIACSSPFSCCSALALHVACQSHTVSIKWADIIMAHPTSVI